MHIQYDKSSGKILTVQDFRGYIPKISKDTAFLLTDTFIQPSEFYVESEQLVKMPEKPNDYSEFNWQTKQWEANSEIAIQQVLSTRQQLLITSDWTDTYSASIRLENYNAWQFYRQQLRDITTQEGYPFNVEWPTQPV
jgi:hypothetical protein